MNALNFLRSIQEYKILIIPKCFEPSLLSQSATQILHKIYHPQVLLGQN